MTNAKDKAKWDFGPLTWMTRNRVTPNLLMLVLLIGGLLMSTQIKQEVIPDFALDKVKISVPYPGASPEEIERGIILSIEEAIRGIDGVKEVSSVAVEGNGSVIAEMMENADQQQVYNEIKQEVDRIRTFPEDAEEPEVTLLIRKREVLSVELYGDVSEWALRELVEHVRDRLLLDPQITQIELKGARRYEVHVEVRQQTLRTYGLTLDDIARKIRATALELPGGKIETRGGEILLRMKERRDWAKQFANIPIVTTPQGAVLYLDDIAKVRDTFEDTDTVGTFNGQRAMGISVYRVGRQTPVGVSTAVRRAMKVIAADLPPGVHYGIRRDMSKIYQQRLHLLLKNAFCGLTLVLLLLGMFLDVKLAAWVTMGIPTSFLGAMLFLPAMGVTINMISMFAFIIALGIVVDDAIVAGENIYEYRQRGMGLVESAVRGARDVAVPVSYSILTNIVAFIPLMAVPGFMGKIFRVIPMVVITVFSISWFEAIFILPAHLAHTKTGAHTALGRVVHRWQQAFSEFVLRAINNVYGPFLDRCIRGRYITVAVGLAALAMMGGYVASGRIGLILMPRVEADFAYASATLPVGCPLPAATAVRDRLEKAARKVAAQNGGDRLFEGVFAVVNENKVELSAYLTDADVRPITTTQFTKLWRERAGAIPGLEMLRFEADRFGPGHGAALTVELSHRRMDVLDRASARLAEILAGFPNCKDIDDGYTPGKQQLNFTLRPEGDSLGLTVADVARQVRNAFYGAEALRQQRGRNEIKVMVRRPESQRISEFDVENFMVRTPAGRDVPLPEVATVQRGRAYTAITRRNARRTVQVTANVEPIGKTNQVKAALSHEILPQLARQFPGLAYSYQGRQADMSESVQSLVTTFVLAMIGIYVLLAIPFGSYLQPAIVMTAIPFGIVGAVIGHIIMGYNLSIISMMGVVALAGVVVNDSLVLIDYANRLVKGGARPMAAIHEAGIRRFRPIILTTMTTFGGLAPMIFETSMQARFIIPMAISLGYGIVFGTLITLAIVPCLYLVLEDVRNMFASH